MSVYFGKIIKVANTHLSDHLKDRREGGNLYLFIIEEGFPLKDLEQVVSAMAAAAREAGVLICTGDTKVVERGKGDGIYINTSGVGIIDYPWMISPSSV